MSCLFSVALSVPFALRLMGLRVTEHPALWSSDFPPLQKNGRSDHLLRACVRKNNRVNYIKFTWVLQIESKPFRAESSALPENQKLQPLKYWVSKAQSKAAYNN